MKRWIIFLSPLLFFIVIQVLENHQTNNFQKNYAKENQTDFKTSLGNVGLPIHYYEGNVLGAFYLVDPEVAQSMLPEGMEPLTLPFINKAIGGLFMLLYTKTTIGRYHEIGLTIQAKKTGSDAGVFGYLWDLFAHTYHQDWMLNLYQSENTGLYVVTLPLEGENGKTYGREIWGYEKYNSKFSSVIKEKEFFMDLNSEFSIKTSHNQWFKPTTASLPFLTYSVNKGETIRTIVKSGYKISWGYSDYKLHIYGNGITADKMKLLKMDELSPIAVFKSDELKTHLPKGKVIK
jgi:hypothetical protein